MRATYESSSNWRRSFVRLRSMSRDQTWGVPTKVSSSPLVPRLCRLVRRYSGGGIRRVISSWHRAGRAVSYSDRPRRLLTGWRGSAWSKCSTLSTRANARLAGRGVERVAVLQRSTLRHRGLVLRLRRSERLRTISMTRSWSHWLILEPEGRQSP
jgi:hypothetical protein